MSSSPAFVRPDSDDWTPTEPGVRRRILTHNDQLMLVEVAFEKGAIGSLHSHPHIQATVVLDGAFEVTIDGVTEVLTRGQSFIVQSNLVHGAKALEAGSLLDTFTPTRAEFL
jgi:quercetin dioxygenase-like cupin family protein